MDYTPYDGMEITGWPRTVINQGRVVVYNETLQVERGSGSFLEREPGVVAPLGDDALLSHTRTFEAKLL
jgi:dihydropyrimidinase